VVSLDLRARCPQRERRLTCTRYPHRKGHKAQSLRLTGTRFPVLDQSEGPEALGKPFTLAGTMAGRRCGDALPAADANQEAGAWPRADMQGPRWSASWDVIKAVAARVLDEIEAAHDDDPELLKHPLDEWRFRVHGDATARVHLRAAMDVGRGVLALWRRRQTSSALIGRPRLLETPASYRVLGAEGPRCGGRHATPCAKTRGRSVRRSDVHRVRGPPRLPSCRAGATCALRHCEAAGRPVLLVPLSKGT
jgi:hypothetical protein